MNAQHAATESLPLALFAIAAEELLAQIKHGGCSGRCQNCPCKADAANEPGLIQTQEQGETYAGH